MIPKDQTNGTSSPTVDPSWTPLVEQPIDAGRPVRVVCIGAGFSGIGAAIHFREHIRQLDFQIYDKETDVGGVWHVNRYAGVGCDIPSHAYQYSFCENTQWSRFYAPGKEIHEYLRNVVDHYNLRPLMKLQHEVTRAKWSVETGKWTLQIKDLKTDSIITDEADFILYATGLLSNHKWPAIPNREAYKGILHHSSRWDFEAEASQPGFSWADKHVAVIGIGSSAIQILPQLQKRAKHVTTFARSQTWLATPFSSTIIDQLGPGVDPTTHTFTAEQRASFRNPEAYHAFRQTIDSDLNSAHRATERGHPLQVEFRKILKDIMNDKLATKPKIADALIPDFPVACKRLTPGPGYLESLTADNVSFETSEIMSFTEKGLETGDGQEHKFDAIICATGFDNSFVPRFPIEGLKGVNLQDLWTQEVRQYLSVSAPEMPNFFPILTAQSAVGSGSLLVVMEQQIAYATQCIQKCQREGYKSMVVKDSAVDSWLKYTDDYFDRTVYTTNCKSWYKNGAYGKAKIRTLWPGSCLHAYLALKHPRWEDFDYERLPEFHHPMAWLGNGDIREELSPDFCMKELRAMKSEHPMFT